MGYTARAISGFSWQTVQKLATSAVSLIKIYVLARLLSPDDFGLFSLTAIAIGATESLTETGINLTILQAKQSIEYFLDTAWVFAILRGLVIGCVMVGLGFGMEWYFASPLLLQLVLVAALIPVIKGFINPVIVSMHKNMAFMADSTYRFLLVVVEALASVGFAFLIHSVWALVFGMVTAAIFEVLISFLFFKQHPRFRWLAAPAKHILENARPLSFATFFHYLNENVDNLLVGKMVGTYNLGIYQNAYALSHKVNYEITKSIHHGVIPIYTRIVGTPNRLKQAFLKSLGATFGIILLGSLPLVIAPELVVTWLLGPQWLEAIPLLRILTFAGLVQSFSSTCYTFLLAKKSYRSLNIHLVLTFSLTIVCLVLLGKTGGLVGAVTGILLARVLTTPLIWWSTQRELNIVKT